MSAPTVLAASPQNVLDGTLLNSMAVRGNGGAAPRGPAEDHDNCDTASASNAAHAHVDVKLEPIGPLSPTPDGGPLLMAADPPGPALLARVNQFAGR